MANESQYQEIYFYPHTSLKERPRHIRVCDIQPGESQDPIVCNLRAVSLDGDECYEALSYVWGDPNDRISITIENKELPVTKKLETALRYLRYPDRVRTLWIDAICINQTDIPERNTQIPLMCDIYGRAESTTSWLGMELAVPMACVFPFFNIFREGEDLEGGVSATFSKKLTELDLETLNIEWLRPVIEAENADTNVYTFVAKFLYIILGQDAEALPSLSLSPSENYWCRAWTAQEVARSRSVTLQAGPLTLGLNDIEGFAKHMENGYMTSGAQGFLDSMRAGVIDYGPGAPRPSLFEALIRNRQRVATDPRDKIYAFIGLSDWNEAEAKGYEVQYSSSVRNVYVNAVKIYVEIRGNLNIIAKTRLGYQNPEFGLPSWCPDWTIVPPAMTPEPKPIWEGFDIPREISFESHPETEVLAVKGFALGHIVAVSPAITHPPRDPEKDADADMLARTLIKQLNQMASILTSLEQTSQMKVPMSLFENIIPDSDEPLTCRVLDLFAYKLSHLGADDLSSVSRADLMTLIGSVPKEMSLYTMLYTTSSDRAFVAIDLPSRQGTDQVLEAGTGDEKIDHGLAGRVFETCKHLWDGECTLGLGSNDMRKGDVVALLVGCDLPLVLRECTEGLYKLVGTVYVDSVSRVGAASFLAEGKFEGTQFQLI